MVRRAREGQALITSTANPRVKLLRSLHHRAGRVAHGLILVEGVRLLEEVASAGFRPVLLLYDPVAVAAHERAQRLLATLHAEETYPADARVIRAVAATETPQPLVAAVPSPPPATTVAGRLVLVLDAVRDPGNLGTICRTALAAGVVSVVLGPTSTDPFSPKALRAGMGAQFRLGLVVDRDWPAIRALLGDRTIRLAAVGAGEPYYVVDWLAPSALIVGGEAHGASAAARAMADQTVHIPMAPGVESLNVAVATAVLVFEARRQWLTRSGGGSAAG